MASTQYGLVTVRQLLELGYTANRMAALVRKGWLTRIRRGVYRLPGVPSTWRASVMAAVLCVGGDVVVSHFTAAALWGLIEHADLNGRVQITASKLARRPGIDDYRRVLHDDEKTTSHTIPVTTIERTILDVAEFQPVGRVGRMIDDAIRRKLTTTDRIAAAVERHRGRGAPRLMSIRQALAQRGSGYDPGANDWERRMDDMWEEMGLPPAERQATITLPGGKRVRPDRVVHDIKLAVEWNGFAWHGLRSDFESDIERRNLLLRAGWAVLEFHSRQSPREICETVLEVYERLRSASVSAS